ncbi:cytochrome P450 94B3-like [Momordica charantia]|uniref:Cytochrome P450 94B3-like n=1 Tax=Momordica charantia TaxID=3673 RepID=A0A6J1DCT1_MOMCH|nr:cytochrome P450 94B3-like [Momordica charantia]
MDIFLAVLILTSLSVCLYLRLKKSKAHEGFKNFPIVGTLPLFLWNRHRYLDWTAEVISNCRTSTAVFRRPGKVHGVITANPDVVEHMLKTHFENYPKGERFVSLLEDFLGGGIFNSDGEIWRVQRKTASYEFNTRSLRNFVMENVAMEIGRRLIPVFERASETGRVLDLQDVLERFSFDNVCKLAFDYDPGCLGGDGTTGAEFMRAFANAATLSYGRYVFYCSLIIGAFVIGTCSLLPSQYYVIAKSPFRFPVFHAGPRMCLGKDMAFIQMKSIAAAVIERFHVEVVENEKAPKYLLSLTLRMENGLQVMLKKRHTMDLLS